MKKIILTMLLLTMITISSVSANTVQLIDTDTVIDTYASFDFDNSNIKEQVNSHEVIFVAEIKKTSAIKEYDGSGIELPYTSYDVKVIEVLKGDFKSKNVEITYFGGFQEGNLHVVNRNSEQLVDCLPIEGEYYIIVANQENSIKNNGRIKDSSYVVPSSENITHLKLLNEEELHTNKDVKLYVSQILKSEETQNPDTPFLVIEDGGGGGGTGSSGNSFTEAIELTDGINIYAYLSSGDEKYFKFYSDNIDGLVIQSTYTSIQLDVKAYMYDDFYTLLTVDYDSGDYSNFLINYQTSAGRYYYIKVQAENSSDSGSFNIRYDIDIVCTCINSANNLVLGYDSVNINKNIIWKGSTQYDYEWNYSINQWNDEGYVTIKEDTWLLDATLDVDDYEDTSSGAYIAYFQNGNLFTDDKIRINTAKFDTMTSQERFKTLMHELGHALGIDEMNPATTSNPYGNENISVTESSLNVMVQGKRALTEIGPCDRNVLRYLWE